MDHPKRIYELLLDHCATDAKAERILIGLVWTLCRSEHATGLCMTPQLLTRTLPWSGDLAGKPLADLAAMILDWNPYESAVALSAINCCLNAGPMPASIILENTSEDANLAVFEHFLPQLDGRKIVVIGRYPGIERYQNRFNLDILELQAGNGDLPHPACEYLIPEADWVFLTASSLANKTFPRLAELASQSKTVLMGPSTPWLPQLHEFGIDYLAGVEITCTETLYRTIAEGGGKRIFNHGLCYRVAALDPATNMAWLKQQIADCAETKHRLTEEMSGWYASGKHSRYSGYDVLEKTRLKLSRMDSSYKALWDQYGKHL